MNIFIFMRQTRQTRCSHLIQIHSRPSSTNNTCSSSLLTFTKVLPYWNQVPISAVVWKRRIVYRRKSKPSFVVRQLSSVKDKLHAIFYLSFVFQITVFIEFTKFIRNISILVCGQFFFFENGWFSREKTNSVDL